MKCRYSMDDINKYVEGGLAFEERECLGKHLKSCGKCRIYYSSLILTGAYMNKEEKAAPDLQEKVMNRLDSGRYSHGGSLSGMRRTAVKVRPVIKPLLAAAAVILLALLVSYNGQRMMSLVNQNPPAGEGNSTVESTVQAENGKLGLTMETSHFSIRYSSRNKKYAGELSSVIEEIYGKISRDLDCGFKKRMTIMVWPDVNSFHNVAGMPDKPVVYRADYINDVFHIAPVTNAVECDDQYYMVKGITARLFEELKTGNDCEWLMDGICMHELYSIVPDMLSQVLSFDKETIKLHIAYKFNNNTLPSLTELSDNYESYMDDFGDELAFTAVDFIVNRYGTEKLAQFIRSPGAYEKVFGFTEKEFSDKWTEYLKENYM